MHLERHRNDYINEVAMKNSKNAVMVCRVIQVYKRPMQYKDTSLKRKIKAKNKKKWKKMERVGTGDGMME